MGVKVGGSVGPASGGVSTRGWGVGVGPVRVTGGWGLVRWVIAVGLLVCAAVIGMVIACIGASIFGFATILVGIVRCGRGAFRKGVPLILVGSLITGLGLTGTHWFWDEFQKQQATTRAKQQAADRQHLANLGVTVAASPGRHIDVNAADGADNWGSTLCIYYKGTPRQRLATAGPLQYQVPGTGWAWVTYVVPGGKYSVQHTTDLVRLPWSKTLRHMTDPPCLVVMSPTGVTDGGHTLPAPRLDCAVKAGRKRITGKLVHEVGGPPAAICAVE